MDFFFGFDFVKGLSLVLRRRTMKDEVEIDTKSGLGIWQRENGSAFSNWVWKEKLMMKDEVKIDTKSRLRIWERENGSAF